nr:hypothetical protein [Stenotrophomonas maltophilia]
MREEAMIGQRSENFEEWRPDEMDGDHSWDVGEVRYSIDGSMAVDLFENAGKNAWVLMFASPLTVRIAQEGSLHEYWESGVVVAGHNLMRATSSSLLTWLENSSGGVHSSGDVAHYAVFSDDVCVEVLSRVVPSLMPVDT